MKDFKACKIQALIYERMIRYLSIAFYFEKIGIIV